MSNKCIPKIFLQKPFNNHCLEIIWYLKIFSRSPLYVIFLTGLSFKYQI